MYQSETSAPQQLSRASQMHVHHLPSSIVQDGGLSPTGSHPNDPITLLIPAYLLFESRRTSSSIFPAS